MTMTFGKRGGLAALALAVGACSPSYYRISTELVTSSHGSRAEVTTTKAYETDALRVTRVALLAPDECSDQSATQTRGTGRDARALVKLRCGVEMMLLERELASVGYQVISWRALSEMVGREEHITSLEAARRLGADPSRSVAIEDSAPGIASARAAGMKTVAIPHWLTERHELGAADLRVQHAGELTVARLATLLDR